MIEYKTRIEKINKSIELLTKNEDIKSIISIGSFSQSGFDEFSDIDLYVFTNNSKKYLDLSNNDWVLPLGKIISRKVFRDEKQGVDKSKIIFKDGLMFDITVVEISKFNIIKYYLKLKKIHLMWVLPGFVRNVIEMNLAKFYRTIQRGHKVHLDRVNIVKAIADVISYTANVKQNKLTEAKFLSHHTNFWQLCYTASIKLIRGDFYHVMIMYDPYIRLELLRALEWKTLLEDSSADVFYNGAKINMWTEPDLYDQLFTTLLKDDLISMQQGIINAAEIYQNLSHSIAKAHNFSLDLEFEDFVLQFMKKTAVQEILKQ